MTLYLENARLLDHRSLELRTCHLAAEAGEGGGVTEVDAVPEDAERIDCDGQLVTRSFAIAHHHAYSALARGMPAPARPPRSFVEILELVWWNLDRKLDPDMVRASALATALDAVRCGVTFVVDHHSSPGAAAGSLHRIAAELERVGVGHLLCYELSDRDGPGPLEQALEETDRYLAAHQGLVGLHASFTVGDALLERAVALARRHGTGLHVHVAEAESDQRHCLERHGTRVVERFAAAGVLDSPRTLLAHCLHLDDAERARIAASPAWIVHNPESNLHNGVGSFDARGLGSRILLGTDGMHSDALASARAAFLCSADLPPLGAYRRLRRVHDYLRAGGVAGDGDNDLVVLDYPSPTEVTAANWPAHVVYGLSRAHVRHVIRAGRVVLRDRRVTALDEDEALDFCREQATRLWQRLS